MLPSYNVLIVLMFSDFIWTFVELRSLETGKDLRILFLPTCHADEKGPEVRWGLGRGGRAQPRQKACLLRGRVACCCLILYGNKVSCSFA